MTLQFFFRHGFMTRVSSYFLFYLTIDFQAQAKAATANSEKAKQAEVQLTAQSSN